MKNLLLLLVVIVILIGCVEMSHSTYPRYKIETFNVIPSDLVEAYKEYTLELISTSSKDIRNNDDAYETLREADRLSRELFEVEVVGLRKEWNDSSEKDLFIVPKDFNDDEIRMFKVLELDSYTALSLSLLEIKERELVENKNRKQKEKEKN